ncbi:GTP-sensing pleiotropic transcriptional regulator CodY [Proteiniclasticum sp. QWL-01]|uniref:GTP-sensing pleiotropic transcriptional regulator CodY n=1 Tax=Proteiniclasticum sp. QWL-01 TaxID=3036945 RepID=UPI0024114EBF|nr:GTP-sensing pleiotropic transcriptional regulator CodY [Proteiniclasticum sp. QWL-01]WFF74278.1 GTP-sensing pleiotropic transcriptional regulator CodY [Proteiniclasticum sp. QWL-01]
MSLLQKTRRLNKIQQRSGYEQIQFDEVCKILSEELDCNVYVISRKGKILGHDHALAFTPVESYKNLLRELQVPEDYNEKLLSVNETLTNLDSTHELVLNMEKGLDLRNKMTTIIPVIGNRERLGTLVINLFDRQATDEDLVLLEYSATIMGIEINRQKQAELEVDTRERQVVELALNTLSYSEAEAVKHIFNELDGNEGRLVASKIADQAGITRSVIVNALRKFESAGVIKSRSLGMKGTHITVLNDKLLEEMKRRF